MTIKKRQSSAKSPQNIWLKISMLSMLTVVMSASIIGMFFYNNWSKTQNQNHYKQSSAKVKHISLTLNQVIALVENELHLMKRSSDIADYRQMQVPGEYVEEIMSVNNRLFEFCQSYPYMVSAYYYNDVYETIVTNYYGSIAKGEFYDTDWLNKIQFSTSTQSFPVRFNVNSAIMADSKKKSLLQFKPEKVISIAVTERKEHTIIANISSRMLYDYLDSMYVFDDYDFYWVDGDGNITLGPKQEEIGNSFKVDFSKENDGVIETEEMTYFVQPMKDGQYSVTVYDGDYMKQPISYFRNYILVVCVVTASLLTVIFILLSRRVYHPVTELFESIKSLPVESPPTDDEFQYIVQLYHKLSTDNSAMANTLSSYHRSLLKYHYKEFILQSTSNKKILSFEKNGISLFSNDHYQLFVYRIEKKYLPENCYMVNANICEAIDTYLSEEGHGFFIDMEKTLFLALISGSNAEQISSIELVVRRLLESFLEVPIYIGQSMVITSAEDIPAVYEETREASDYAVFFHDSNVRTYKDIPVETSEDQRAFLSNLSNKYINSLSCDQKGMDTINAELEQYLAKITDVFSYKSAYVQIVSSIQQANIINANMGSSPQESECRASRLEDIYHAETYAEVKGIFGDYLQAVMQGKKKCTDSENLYCSKAKEFMEENYCRDISTTDISAHLNISYPYLSKLFKDDTGMGLLDYLNIVRVEKSKEYLLKTEDTLPKIAQKIGYNNSQSYQRHFKRLMGITPGDFRKLYGER